MRANRIVAGLITIVIAIGLCWQRPALSAEELLAFESPEQQQFFELLTHEFRCLKCQNQTIADSNADLAGDLRREIYTMVLDGKSRSEITDYLVQRYGDFVLYRPRWQATTLLLWLGPPLLLILALLIAWLVSRKQSRPAPATELIGEQTTDSTELHKARSLLDK